MKLPPKNSPIRNVALLPAARLRLRITPDAERQIRGGHPWLYAESIREQNRDGRMGELAVIYDRRDRFLAVGLFDPDSPLRVRVLHAGQPQPIDWPWWKQRFEQAMAKRRGLFDEQTNAGRWIHGESDGWPGLVLDRYDTTLVLKLYTAAWLPRLDELTRLIRESPSKTSALGSTGCQPGPSGNLPDGTRAASMTQPGAGFVAIPGAIPVGRLPTEAGRLPAPLIFQTSSEMMRPERLALRLSRNIPETTRQEFKMADGIWLHTQSLSATVGQTDSREVNSELRAIQTSEETGGMVTFLESGLRFEADVLRGQKTGFFLDQRENRRLVESLAGGRAVLNAFSFSGGFSLYSARGGARSVIDLDISAHALTNARRNFALNESNPAVAACRHETIQADAFEWLQSQSPRRLDLIVLDPPALAKRESERAAALSAYTRLVRSALKHLRAGGILVAASCSAHVPAGDFFQTVRRAAGQAKRKFAELQTTRHPPDHPAAFKEAEYLKCIYIKV